MACLDLSDIAYVIFHATVPSVHGTAHFLNVLKKVGVSPHRQRVVLNYNFPRVPARLRVEDVVERLSREVDYVFPYDRKVLTALNTGRVYATTCSKRFGFGGVLHRMVRDIEGMPEPGPSLARQGGPAFGAKLIPRVST
jgi:hypothetical protein